MADTIGKEDRKVSELWDVPELIPVRMLNEFTYCPRLFYLEWVQGEFEDNADTREGRFQHRTVDRERERVERDPETSEAGMIRTTSVLMSAPEEGLIARMDLVEFDGHTAVPVDYKRGRVPDIPGGAWEPERVQLCAQGLILRENGYNAKYGVLYYVESRTRVDVPFDDELIHRTRSLVQELRKTAARGQIPPPLQDSPKCPRCSLVGICLPDEVNYLAQRVAAADRIRRLTPPRDDRVPVYVQEQGAYVRKSGDRLQVTKDGETLADMRLLDVMELNLFGNVQVSTQTVRELCQRDIPIAYYSYGGWLSGITVGMGHKNVELRLHQYGVATDPVARLDIAREIVAGKIQNCRTFLRRNHTDPPKAALDELKRLRNKARRASSLDALLGIEGAAARVYFSHFAGMLREPWDWDFTGRNRRPPRDPVNALLSFCYALLTKDALAAVLKAGFDPFLGVYHSVRYGRPALALDLQEEFRPLIADSVTVSVLNNGEIKEQDFVRRAAGVALTEKGRRKVLEAYERRVDTSVTHPVFGYSLTYRRVMAVQARLLARRMLGEIPRYVPFVTR